MRIALLPIGLSIVLAFHAYGQSDDVAPYAAKSRSPHETVWQRFEWSTNSLGRAVARTNEIVEVATGLNHLSDETPPQWQPSREEWEVYPDAIVARAGQHKVILSHNLADGVDVLLADGVTRLVSSPVSLGFYDPVDGKQMVFAEVKDCKAERGAAANEIVFRECFDRVRGSIRFLYTKAGVHQHVVLEQKLALPEGFSDRSRLEGYTVFAPETPWPRITTRALRGEKDPVLRAQMVEPDFTDAELDFGGGMAMRAGTAFSLGEEAEGRTIRVGKQFVVIEGQPVLIEAVEFRQLEPLLAGLASVERADTRGLAINSTRQIKRAKEQAPLPREHYRGFRNEKEIQLASNPLREPAVVIDYELLSSGTARLTGGTTWYVSGLVNVTNLIVEGTAVVKFTNSPSAKIVVYGTVDCQTGPYRPAIFTVKDDNTVGQTISGSTGNPTNQYGSGLAIMSLGNTLTNLRFTHLYEGLSFDSGGSSGWLNVGHAQFVKCRYPLNAQQSMCFLNCGATIHLDNALITDCDVLFRGDIGILRAQHLTASKCNQLGEDYGNDCALYLTNSLLVAVTNWGNMTYTTNTTVYYATDPGGIFQTVGAGAHYLVNGSTNRNMGTTNINAELLAGLRMKTTYPPVVLSNASFSASTNLAPQAARDTDLPDLGFHYDPLDWLCSQINPGIATVTITLTNGVAVGLYGYYGFSLRENNRFVSEGRPEAMNRIVWYPSVQEQPVKLNNVSIGSSGMFDVTAASSTYTAYTKPILRLRFTELVGLGRRQTFFYPVAYYYGLNTVALTDCWLRSVDFTVSGYNWTVTGFPVPVATLQNDLVERGTVSLFNGYFNSAYQCPLAANLYNNLFWSSSLALTYNDYYATAHPNWYVKDNLFDTATNSFTGTGSYTTSVNRSNNGFYTTTNNLGGTTNLTLTALSYATGAFGSWYIASSTPTLVDQGSRNAYTAGLFHFTTTTNQVKESYSVVDMGFHYVAATNGAAMDLDADGTPDYADPDAEPPIIVAQTQPDRHWSSPSAPLVLWVSATGAPFLNHQWQLFGTNLPSARSTNYMVLFGTSEERDYSCTVGNTAGVTTSQTWKVRALLEGSLAAWGANGLGQLERPDPATNVIAVAAGGSHSLAAREDGSVLGWGLNDSGQTNAPTLTNAIAVAAGYKHSLALRDNGTFVAWGRNVEGQTNALGLTNVIAIGARGNQSMALMSHGTVTNWGQTFGTIPASLTNAIAIAAGTNFCLALRSNGTVVAWGDNANGQTNVPAGLTNVVAIAAGDFHGLALKVDGAVTNWGLNTSGQTNVPVGLSNVMAIAAGRAHSVALKNDGTVVCRGDNSFGQTNSGGGLIGIKLLAAGGNHTLASAFSTLVQYQVDVSKDLLLIYNTNWAESTWVKNYYLAHRPMVSGANSLEVSCPTNEVMGQGVMGSASFANTVLTPYLSWLTNNPTKRPQYIVYFYGLPERIEDGSTVFWSPSYYLHTAAPGIKPFVTCINMRTTNDCAAYIDKLVAFGTNDSVSISASSGGLWNTNYYLDDGGQLQLFLTNGVTGVLANSGAISAITYVPPGSGHVYAGTNLAAYASWGAHGGLGGSYATNGLIAFSGASCWYIIETIESFNGQRDNPNTGQGNFLQWFSHNAVGGTNYSSTPVGAVTHVEEPGSFANANDPSTYFGRWAAGKRLAICGWTSSPRPDVLQVVGDPFVRK